MPTPQEATVYTNIEPADRQKLEYGGDEGNVGLPPPSATVSIMVDAGQDDGDINDDMEFTGSIGGVPGTFMCDDTCGVIETETNEGGQTIITAALTSGWTFESSNYVESQADQDTDFMYFGYWLQSPEDVGDEDPAILVCYPRRRCARR